MYTFNYLVFGHNLAINHELNNAVHEFDLSFQTTINGKEFVVDTPYHGGQVNGDTLSVVFGCNITSDESNPDYINLIRNAKEEDYLADYNKFIDELTKDLTSNKGEEGDYDKFVDELIKFLKENKPTFYSVEASS